jgi:hypothetical protein
MFIITLPKSKNVISVMKDFHRWVISLNKSFIQVVPRVYATFGKDNNHSFAFPLNEKGKNFSFTTINISKLLHITYLTEIMKMHASMHPQQNYNQTDPCI